MFLPDLKMHFQQAVPIVLQDLSNLEPIQLPIQKTRNSPLDMIGLFVSLLALPILQVVGQSRGLSPTSSTCKKPK